MIKIVFKNVEPSEITRQLVCERLEPIERKFPDLENHTLLVTLGMENSPQQAGADMFFVKLRINGRKYRSLQLRKASHSLYIALADVCESLLETINRAGDRYRVSSRARARSLKEDGIYQSRVVHQN